MEVIPVTVTDRSAHHDTHHSLRCRLGFHSWYTMENDGGQKYMVCSHCLATGPYVPTSTPLPGGWV